MKGLGYLGWAMFILTLAITSYERTLLQSTANNYRELADIWEQAVRDYRRVLPKCNEPPRGDTNCPMCVVPRELEGKP